MIWKLRSPTTASKSSSSPPYLVLEERGDILREALTEAIEDIALARAIEEGEGSETITRDEVFALLER